MVFSLVSVVKAKTMQTLMKLNIFFSYYPICFNAQIKCNFINHLKEILVELMWLSCCHPATYTPTTSVSFFSIVTHNEVPTHSLH